jgi:hypothetical protein
VRVVVEPGDRFETMILNLFGLAPKTAGLT